MPMKMDVSITTKIKGTMFDEAEPGLNGVTFAEEKYETRYLPIDVTPKTRYTHDNIYLSPSASITIAPGYVIDYVYIFMRRTAAIQITQVQGESAETITIHSSLLEMKGEFTSFVITSLDEVNVTEGKILLIGRNT